MFRWREWLLVGFLGGHLVSAIFGGLKIEVPLTNSFNQGLALVRVLTASHYSWGFFAPEVGTQFKVTFVETKRDGSIERTRLPTQGPNEVDLRRGGIISTFWYALKSQDLRRSLTASWAATRFRENPDTVRVRVEVRALKMQSMSAVRSGENNYWGKVYEATFTKQG